jgi:HSP20 family protein
MALSSFGNGRTNSPWDSLWLESAWDPFEIMDPSPARSFAQNARAIAGTKVDWVERDDAHILKADIPGLTKEDVKVQLENDRTLQISGERKHEEVKKGDTWHAVERSHGKFLRRFKLPDDAQTDSVSAKVEDGVLVVTVPKTQIKKPEKKSIEVA